MSKIITVFGATGKQGGSVVRAILADPILSKEFKVRAVTRDTGKPAAKDLAAKGADVVAGDLSSPESVQRAVNGAHTVFSVTNFWETMSPEVEITQGKTVADASKAAGVKHLIWSSLLNVTQLSGGTLLHVPHFDCKAEVESYIREIGVPATFFLPGPFMASFLEMMKKGDDGTYTFALPVGDEAKLPMIDTDVDAGKFVVAIIKNRDSLLGEQVYAGADYYTPSRIAKEFAEVTGKPLKVVKLPGDTFKSFLPPAIAEELYETTLFFAKPGYFNGADLTESHKILGNEKPSTWKDFLSRVWEKTE